MYKQPGVFCEIQINISSIVIPILSGLTGFMIMNRGFFFFNIYLFGCVGSSSSVACGILVP